jgi:hypothetical protein
MNDNMKKKKKWKKNKKEKNKDVHVVVEWKREVNQRNRTGNRHARTGIHCFKAQRPAWQFVRSLMNRDQLWLPRSRLTGQAHGRKASANRMYGARAR